MKKNILILGAHGMLGRTMFFYLSSKFPHTVWGTIRELSNEKNKFFLSVGSYEKDIQTIFKKIKHIDYIINCIAATDIDTDKTTLIKVNTNFPENIAQIAERKKSKLIHVSTDGVFSELAQEMNESDTPFPTNEYTKSKLSGEPYDSSNALSIRTSLLGFD